jgi:hypothetical protein
MRTLKWDEMELVAGGKVGGGGKSSGGGNKSDGGTKSAPGKVNKDGTKANETKIEKTPAPKTWRDYLPSSGCFAPSAFGVSLGEICWGK